MTGGTGFLGSYIILELLKQGYRVRATRRSNTLPGFQPAGSFEGVQWVDGDILDVMALEEAMHGVDAVIHSAAVVSFAPDDRKPMYQVNVDGTANVVNMALEAGVGRFVHISSVAAIGRGNKDELVTEEKKWDESGTHTHYALSKHKAEMEVWRGMGEGLDAVILNPSTILGYGDWSAGSAAIFRQMNKGFRWYTPGVNGFVDVEDVARAAVLLMESGISEERFIVNADNWSFHELLGQIAHSLGRTAPDKESSEWMVRILWRMERLRSAATGVKPVITKESARVAFSQTRFSNSKLLAALPGFGFRPLTETIAEAGARYRASIHGM